MLTTREYMEEARDLIAQKRYDDAREILVDIDHPVARKWLDKLDEIDPPLLDDPFAEAQEAEPVRPKRKSPTDKGELLGVFGINIFEFIRRLIYGLFFGVVAGFMMSAGVSNKNEEAIRLALILAGAGLLILALGFLGNVAYTFLIDRKTLIHEYGVERKTRKGLQFYSFEQINAVQGYLTVMYTNGITTVIIGSFKFFHDDTPLFAVYGMDRGFSQLSGYVIQKIEETHKSRLLKEYRSGKTLHFKPIELRPDGLHYDKKHLTLADFDGMEVDSDSVKIGNKKTGRAWKRYHLSAVRNPWLLEAILNSVTKY